MESFKLVQNIMKHDVLVGLVKTQNKEKYFFLETFVLQKVKKKKKKRQE